MAMPKTTKIYTKDFRKSNKCIEIKGGSER